jgi:hypothetical protein
MISRVCICCGEPMPEKASPLCRNPNVCVSCASLADEMEESDGLDPICLEQDHSLADATSRELRKAA